MSEALDRQCERIGRDPASLRRTWCGGCACAPTTEQAAALAAGRLGTTDEEDYDFIGTAAQVIEQMSAFTDIGVDYFILDGSGFPDLTTLEFLAAEVLPALNGSH